MSLADELRKQTQEANDLIRKQEQSRRQVEEAQNEAKRLAAIARANAIIAEVEGKCRGAASGGKRAATIMTLEIYGKEPIDIIDPPRDRKATRMHLSLTAAMVYDHIILLGLKPEIKWDHDGVGIRDWYRLVASWEG